MVCCDGVVFRVLPVGQSHSMSPFPFLDLLLPWILTGQILDSLNKEGQSHGMLRRHPQHGAVLSG